MLERVGYPTLFCLKYFGESGMIGMNNHTE